MRRELSELAQFFQTRFDALGISRRLIELVTQSDRRVFFMRDAALIQPFRTAGSIEVRVL